MRADGTECLEEEDAIGDVGLAIAAVVVVVVDLDEEAAAAVAPAVVVGCVLVRSRSLTRPPDDEGPNDGNYSSVTPSADVLVSLPGPLARPPHPPPLPATVRTPSDVHLTSVTDDGGVLPLFLSDASVAPSRVPRLPRRSLPSRGPSWPAP